MRKYDLPSAEDEEYLDELEKMPIRVIYWLAAFVFLIMLFYCIYTLIGFWLTVFSTLLLSSLSVLFLYIRKGILTARNNTKNGNIRKTTL
jgi:predicted membrane protein